MKKWMMSLLIFVIGISFSIPGYAEDTFTYGDYLCAYNDTGVSILKYNAYPEAGSTLVIPDRIKGRPVTEIAETAFFMKKFTTAEIPETVTTIGNKAFYVCENLISINLPSSVSEIDGNPFYTASALSQIDISADHPVFEVKEGALFQKKEHKLVCYPAGRRGEVYAVPKGTISIGEGAFAGNANLVEVQIPDTVSEIGEGAFFRCFSLRHLEIPASVKDIIVNPFASCTALTDLSVSEDNPFYSIIDGALIDNRDGRLVSVPIISKDGIYTVPEPVKKIGAAAFIQNRDLKIIKMNSQASEIEERAFFYCSNLIKIVLPDSLERIGENAFFNCVCLQDITIPQNVKVIGNGAFKYCEAMNQIRIYSGVEEIGDEAFLGCENLLFEVESGSYAENYARENDFIVQIIELPQEFLSIYGSDDIAVKRYEKGMACFKSGDYEMAFSYFVISGLEKGYAPAQNMLGICYRDGLGTAQNHEEAVRYFRLAADQGLQEATVHLAEIENQTVDTTVENMS